MESRKRYVHARYNGQWKKRNKGSQNVGHKKYSGADLGFGGLRHSQSTSAAESDTAVTATQASLGADAAEIS